MTQERTIAFEVERVLNLVRGFGWVKTKEQIVGNKVVLEFAKEMEAAERVGTDDNPG